MTPPSSSDDKPAAPQNKGFQNKPTYASKQSYKF